MTTRPHLTLIAPVRDTGEEFEQFLASLSAQAIRDDVALLLVAYGDEPCSAYLVERLAAHGLRGYAVVAETVDIALARRVGLERSEGEWVAFPNANDALAQGSVEALRRAIDAHDHEVDAFVIPTAIVSHGVEPTGRTDVSVHPVDDDVTALPSDISRVVLRRHDAPFTGTALTSYADLLLMLDLLPHRPRAVGVVHGAAYLRRSFVLADPQTEHVREDAAHYRGLVADIAGRVRHEREGDGWRHRLAMREVFRLVEFENATTKRATVLGGEAGEQFLGELRALLEGFDESLFDRVNRPDAFDERRDALRGLRGRKDVASIAHVIRRDDDAGLVQVRYSRWAAGSVEQFAVSGTPVERRYGKRRTVMAFGVRVFDQEIAWVPGDAELELAVDGRPVDLRDPQGEPWGEIEASHESDDGQFRQIRLTRTGLRDAVGRARRSWLSKAAALRTAARTRVIRNRYRDAWLLMDRADLGRDNAEHMYRWLQQNHPEVNAWFVLRRDSADFARLGAEGFRLVAYGSWQHQMLLHNTKQYVSSHVGIDVSRPVFDRYLQNEAPWTFTFLQHGVIHNDLSIWLNRQQIRLFVATTPDERDGLAGDDSPYVFTEREVRMTGLPRFDKLRRIADSNPVEKRRSIVIAPTWRNGLFLPPKRPGELRKPKPGFRESPFISSVLAVLNDPRLKALADDGYEVRFVPHPNLAAHFPYNAIPGFVSVTTYAEADVQQLIGTASVFLTDYSSVAFDAAFAGAAVVYMQFDEGAIYGKDHTLAPGYFEFERDGFGPVTRSINQALAAVVAGAREGAAPLYAERIRETFPLWDTGACQRVFDAITELEASRGKA